jgi:hypothetical protein
MLENDLDARITGVRRILEEHGGVLRGLGRGADNPLLVDIGDQGSLTRRAGQRLGAEVREALAGDDGW